MEPTNEHRTLARRTDRRLIAGVAGGLGDHFGVRAGWFRLGFVLATLAGGMGVVAYLLLWFLIPRADLPRSAAQQTADRFPDAPAWAGIVLIGIGVVSLSSQLGIHLGSVAWALLLIGGGLLLYRRGGDVDPARPAPTVANPSSDPGGAITMPLPPALVPRVKRAPRERSPLGWLTLGLALAAAGVVAVLRNAGTVHLSLAQSLAIPLVILGAGVLVGTFVGRARWLVLLAIPLTLVTTVASAFTVPMDGPYGDIYVDHRAQQVRAGYTLSGGTLVFDLTRMDPNQLPATIDARMGAGSVDIQIPRSGVRVEATVGIGDIHAGSGRSRTLRVMDRDAGGFDIVRSLGDPNATTVVTVHVDVGEVQMWFGPPLAPKGGSK
jgi:phage shock protein PspC (stress-responsive transcriptional regulator)